MMFLFPYSLVVPNNDNIKPVVKTVVKETKINYSQYPKILVFIANKNQRGKGILLAVNSKESKIEGIFKALSGVGGREDQPMRGPLPSQKNVQTTRYMVDSDPLILSNPGIAGKFYKINPHLVKVKGTTRGDFGIHFDANVPGTAGCIGIEDPQQWAAFKELMKHYSQSGLTQIPLLVAYR
ncbi:MAG: hypothetical protein WBM32_03640 [Crocosphaera sp.]